MRYFVFPALLALAIVGCDTPLSAPTRRAPAVAEPVFAVVANDWMAFSISDNNPCTGEFSTVTGQVHTIVTATESNGGPSNFDFHLNIHGDGVGASGARYVFNDDENYPSHLEGMGRSTYTRF